VDIYLLRHADASERKEGMKDRVRPLTSLGAATISSVAKSIKKSTKEIDLILTSPFLRARQTADIVGNVFKAKDKIRESENLVVSGDPSDFLDEIKGYMDLKRLLVVGHQPHLSMCISFLTGKNTEEIVMKKASLALIKIDDLKEGAGELIWIKEPTQIKK